MTYPVLNAALRTIGTASTAEEAAAILARQVYRGCTVARLRRFYVFGGGLDPRGQAGQDTVQAWVYVA